MRFITTTLIIMITAFIVEWFGPWWLAAVVAGLIGCLSRLSTGKAFLAGACGIGLLWLAVVLWRDIPNGHLLSQRMAVLILKTPSYPLFIVITVVLGALAGGLSAWAGAHLRILLRPAVRA